ncbi:uncharacterized metal-dependent hydrolase YcfH-like [Ylistrum balloti]|uniref:uncharacterized metal-dependent hydrolase YcfH-like n=1 Tax=Ylistrum balloti TaxID=509963 RepID=UPI002905C8D6|nr:uncharacterized metal-dependent hydrolase YcfH-like [Ylistrum balloti]
MDMTVIVHCRDEGSRESSQRVLSLVREMNLTHLRIHRLCFTDGLEELQKWMACPPNVYFIFTAVVRDEPIRLSAANVYLDKLLLESDSQYLSFKPHHLNTPWVVLEVAGVVAGARGMYIQDVMESASQNFRRIYRLPSWFRDDVNLEDVGADIWELSKCM